MNRGRTATIVIDCKGLAGRGASQSVHGKRMGSMIGDRRPGDPGGKTERAPLQLVTRLSDFPRKFWSRNTEVFWWKFPFLRHFCGVLGLRRLWRSFGSGGMQIRGHESEGLLMATKLNDRIARCLEDKAVASLREIPLDELSQDELLVVAKALRSMVEDMVAEVHRRNN